MEELTDNAEEPDEAESKQSEVKLGKLQYKVSWEGLILTLNISERFKTSNEFLKLSKICIRLPRGS